jgi:hypothetical protein
MGKRSGHKLVNNGYRSVGSRCRGSAVAFAWDPFGYKQTTDAESRFGYRDHRDPEQAPKPERGDKYLLIGAVVGISLGCIAGYIIGSNLLGIGGVFLGLVAGAIIGGLIGLTIGNYIKKRVKMSPSKKIESEEGPFIRK